MYFSFVVAISGEAQRLSMEHKHKNRLKAQFGHLLTYKDIQVLDIADEYQYMDKELVSIIKQSVGSYLALM